MLFADNDGDDGSIIVSEINMWNKALGDSEIAALGSVPVVSSVVLMDFGDPGTSNISSTPWNNISNEVIADPATSLIDDLGNATGYVLTTTDDFQPGFNTGGTSSPTGDALALNFPGTATKDNFYVGINWQSRNETSGAFSISGLDPSKHLS